jgi:hypothetical protein
LSPNLNLSSPDNSVNKSISEEPRLSQSTRDTLLSTEIKREQAEDWLRGGTNAYIAYLCGLAEGNVRPDGSKTQNWYGHRDPNNGEWNIGSFSAQRDLNTGAPETSDQRVIDRLIRPNLDRLFDQAETDGVKVTPLLVMTYIDVLIQAPEAATGWSDRSTGKGLLGNLASLKGRENDPEALVAARVEAYRNTNGRLETTFGSERALSNDQWRRQLELQGAVDRAQLAPPTSTNKSELKPAP